jgi:hypothetical protein
MPKIRTLAIVFVTVAVVSSTVAAQDIDSTTLRVGQQKSELLTQLGAPVDVAEARTLGIKTARYRWVASGGRRLTVNLVFDHVFRWQICSASAVDC